MDKIYQNSCPLLKVPPETYLESQIKPGSATTEILLTFSLCGWWGGCGMLGWYGNFHVKSNFSDVGFSSSFDNIYIRARYIDSSFILDTRIM